MKRSSSCGLDNIDSRVLKIAILELTPAITHIINLSISTQCFPEIWKISKIIPLHKKDELVEPSNYRPVSLLSAVSKILERAIYMQLVHYFETENLLNSSHHGFRQNHNTTTALIEMIDRWAEKFDKGEISAVLMLNMSAAFDLVNHDLLCKKLEIYGANRGSVTWFESYLNNRGQQVYIDGCYSEVLPVTTGVPQGSILGLILYIID